MKGEWTTPVSAKRPSLQSRLYDPDELLKLGRIVA
jgi:hypothetical protein